MKIFVYGTLLRGEPNYPLMDDSEFICPAITLPEYTLLDLGSFPAMTTPGNTSVAGEIYEVSEKVLQRLDALEGHPDWYKRTMIDLSGAGKAETYLLPPEEIKVWPKIKSGDWRGAQVTKRDPDIIKGEYVSYKFATATPTVLFDALHGHPPRNELMTRRIVQDVAKRTGCHYLLATVSRTEANLNSHRNKKNAAAVDEYRSAIRNMLDSSKLLDGNGGLRKPFLHISVHGMKTRADNHFELGTVYGDSCTHSVEQDLFKMASEWARSLDGVKPLVTLNHLWFGDPSIAAHRIGDKISKYPGYGDNYNVVQIEVATYLRFDYYDEVVDLLCQMTQLV